MLSNYLRTAVRNFSRTPFFSLVNVFGLAVGLACCITAWSFIRSEIAYDRFHENADDIYRLSWDLPGFGMWAQVPIGFLWRLKEEYPEVTDATHIRDEKVITLLDGEPTTEMAFMFADSSFLEIFSFPLIRGDAKTVLDAPGSIVLSEATSHRYFDDADPIGKVISLNDGTLLTVTGILSEINQQSHIRFDALISLSTRIRPMLPRGGFDYQGWQFLRVRGPEALSAVKQRIDENLKMAAADSRFGREYFGYYLQDMGLELQPLTSLHLHSDYGKEPSVGTKPRSLYFIGLVSLFVLLLGCANYVNLMTAMSARRNKEVGVRKTLGANRGRLRQQFLGEALILATGALVTAVLLVYALSPLFSLVAGKDLEVDLDLLTLAVVLALTAFVGIVAGIYPAYFLSRLNPVMVLKGGRSTRSGSTLRKILVTFQFTITILLLISTFVVVKQLRYLNAKELGFDTERVVHLPIPNEYLNEGVLLRREMNSISRVESVSLANFSPADPILRRHEDEDGNNTVIASFSVDHEYLHLMEIELLAGRNFDPARAADSMAVIVSESMATLFELHDKLEQAEALKFDGRRTPIGIVRDIHTASLREPSRPVLFTLYSGKKYGALIARIRPEAITATLNDMKTVWTSIIPDYPFDFEFLDDRLHRQYEYESDRQFGRLLVPCNT